MALTAEFKRTGAGVLPSDWEVPQLQSVLRSGRLGGNYRNGSRESGAPLMKMGNLGRGTFDLDKVEFVQDGVNIDQTHRLRKGDVLFNTRNTLDLVGKVAIWRDELPVAYYNSNLMRLEFDRRHVHSNRFASYLLNSAAYIGLLRALATGTTSVAAIYTRDLLQLPFVCPPGAEQRAIAAALSDVDELLTALDQLIAKKRDLKQAAMQQLLTGRRRLPGFAGQWTRRTLGTVLTICHGKSQRDVESPDGPFPILATGGQIGTASAWIYDKPSVLIGRKGTIDRPQYMEAPFWTVDTLFYSAMKGAHCAKFFYYRFCLIDWSKYNEASGVPSLNARTIEAIEVDCPDPLEQIAIAEVLSDMDAELAALEARREKTRQFKQGMMQALLTGRIRLT